MLQAPARDVNVVNCINMGGTLGLFLISACVTFNGSPAIHSSSTLGVQICRFPLHFVFWISLAIDKAFVLIELRHNKGLSFDRNFTLEIFLQTCENRLTSSSTFIAENRAFVTCTILAMQIVRIKSSFFFIWKYYKTVIWERASSYVVKETFCQTIRQFSSISSILYSNHFFVCLTCQFSLVSFTKLKIFPNKKSTERFKFLGKRISLDAS